MDDRDSRVGYGKVGRRLPKDADLNNSMTDEVADYWLNLTKSLDMQSNDGGALPNLYVDMLNIKGTIPNAEDLEFLVDLIMNHSTKRNHSDNDTGTHKYWGMFDFEDVRKLLGDNYGYEATGVSPRYYRSAIDQQLYPLNQHVYMTIKADATVGLDGVDVLRADTAKVELSFNPNRFVHNAIERQFEPVLEFIQNRLLPCISMPYISRMDVNCDLLANAGKLTLTSNDKAHEIDKVNTTRYADENWFKLTKYDKTSERKVNSYNHGYLHADEVERITDTTGLDVARIELRLKEYGIKQVIREHEANLNAPIEKRRKTSKLLPSWLKMVYHGFDKEHPRKQMSLKRLLNQSYLGIYDLVKGLPLRSDVIDDLILHTKYSPNERIKYQYKYHR